MSAPEPHTEHDGERVPLGQLLVDQGVLAQADLDRLLEEQRRTGAPLGRMLVDGGFLAGSTVAMALAEQHGGLLKTEYGFATGRSAAQRAAAVETDAAGTPPPLPPVASFEPQATVDSVSLSPLLLATDQAPPAAGEEPVETRRPDLELARTTPPEPTTTIELPAAAAPLQPVAAEPLLLDEPLFETPPVAADDRDLLAGQLAAAELERDALRDRLDEAHLARRAAEDAAKSGAEAARERLAVLQTDADAANAALTIARDELASAQARLAELAAQPAVPQEDTAAREALAAVQQQAEESAAALADARGELAAAQAQLAELAAQPVVPQEDPAALAEARAELAAAQTRIAELQALDLERVGADIAHQTLVSLQQESEVAAADLAAARDELEAARARIAELSSARADEARFQEQVATLEARARDLQREVESRDARIAELEAELADRPETGEEAEPAEHSYDESHHVLLVPTETGYATLERPGPAPQSGDVVLLPIGRYQVSRRGASPFPSDTRGCAYLIQV